MPSGNQPLPEPLLTQIMSPYGVTMSQWLKDPCHKGYLWFQQLGLTIVAQKPAEDTSGPMGHLVSSFRIMAPMDVGVWAVCVLAFLVVSRPTKFGDDWHEMLWIKLKWGRKTLYTTHYFAWKSIFHFEKCEKMTCLLQQLFFCNAYPLETGTVVLKTSWQFAR